MYYPIRVGFPISKKYRHISVIEKTLMYLHEGGILNHMKQGHVKVSCDGKAEVKDNVVMLSHFLDGFHLFAAGAMAVLLIDSFYRTCLS